MHFAEGKLIIFEDFTHAPLHSQGLPVLKMSIFASTKCMVLKNHAFSRGKSARFQTFPPNARPECESEAQLQGPKCESEAQVQGQTARMSLTCKAKLRE